MIAILAFYLNWNITNKESMPWEHFYIHEWMHDIQLYSSTFLGGNGSKKEVGQCLAFPMKSNVRNYEKKQWDNSAL